MSKVLKATEETEEERYGCSVVISPENVFHFNGSKKDIAENLKFIRFNLHALEKDIEDEKDILKIPVILTQESDVLNTNIFFLRDYEEYMEAI